MKWLFVVTCLLFSSFTWSSTECRPYGETVIFYLNGMFNDKPDRQKTVEELKKIIKPIIPENDHALYEVRSSTNKSEFLPLQLFQVSEMRLMENGIDWERAWKGKAQTPEWARNLDGSLNDEIVNALSSDLLLYRDKDLDDMVVSYKQELQAGKRVIVVAHSQGNMYANNAYARLLTDVPELVDSFSVVHVATPSSQRAGGTSPHTTSHDDKVINGVRFLLSNTLASNGVNDYDWNFMGHSFLNVYLKGIQQDGLARKITDQISQALGTTLFPIVTIEDSDLPNDRLGCDGTVVINDLTVEYGVVTVDSETTSMAIEGQVDGGVYEVESISASFNGVDIDQSEIVFYKDLKAFYINVDGVVEDENSLRITLRDVDGNTIPINEVSMGDVPNGYLPNNGATSAELIIFQEAETCDIIEGDLSTLHCAMSMTITEDENTGDIEGGVLNVAADVNSMTIQGVFQAGLLQKPNSVSLQATVSTHMTLLPDNAFTLQLSNIPEGQSHIYVSFTGDDGQVLQAFPVEAEDATDGLFTADKETSIMTLTVQKEGAVISCDNIPPLDVDPKPVHVLRTGGYGNFSTITSRISLPFEFQVYGDYAHCMATASMNYKDRIIELTPSWDEALKVLTLSGSFYPDNYSHTVMVDTMNFTTHPPGNESLSTNLIYHNDDDKGIGQSVFIWYRPSSSPPPPPVVVF